MPELTLVLPHWIYWAGLFLFPALMIIAVRRAGEQTRSPLSLPLAYFFWLVGGFLGMHRLYLKSWLAAIFIVIFVSLLTVNQNARQSRSEASAAAIELTTAEFLLKRAIDNGDENLSLLEQTVEDNKQMMTTAQTSRVRYEETSRIMAITIFALLLIDAFLLPIALRRRACLEKRTAVEAPPIIPPTEEKTESHPAENVIGRFIGTINRYTGEFCCYWTLIAVFVFYYEVIARYVFNSPTNWAHESMFLMFGMQYLFAGGYCLREGAHVRVDILYLRLSTRGRAIADIISSLFFFIFVLALLVSGWIFFYDSFVVSEKSFTEWGVAYWPIKFALPLGALLLLLQGVARLMTDIQTLRQTT